MTLRELTLVIPAWGEYTKYLRELCGELLRQGVPERQIIVVCEEGAGRPRELQPWPLVGVVYVPAGSSIGAARNRGLRAVRTPLVCFCDADDLPAAGALADCVGALERDPQAVIATGWIQRPGGERFEWPSKGALKSRSRWARITRQWVWNQVPVAGAVVRADAARRVGGFPDLSLAEDGVFACLLLTQGDVQMLDRPVRIYGHNPSGAFQRGPGLREWARAYAAQRAVLCESDQVGAVWKAWARLVRPAHWVCALELARRGARDRIRSGASAGRTPS